MRTKRYTSSNSRIERAELSLYEPYQSEKIGNDAFPKKYRGGRNAAERILGYILRDEVSSNIVPSQLVIWFNDGFGVHRRRFHLNKEWEITKQDGGYY